MAYKTVEIVSVNAWGQLVGAVAKHPTLKAYTFQYASEWLKTGVELAPLEMPLRKEPYTFTSLPEATFKGLPPLLADSLPDDFGNAIVTAALVRAGVSKTQITALDRLAYQGARGMGVLEYEPAQGPADKGTTALLIHDLVEASRAALRGSFVDDTEAKAALLNILEVGTSAGGARAKAVISYNAETGEIRSGQVNTAPGFEHWLVKFDGLGEDKELGTSQDYGRIEYAYYLMARAAGIQMMESTLLHENGRAHFMTKRFDRVAGKKVHVSSLCAMGLMDYKQRATHAYEQYFDVMVALNLGEVAREEGFRRMVFNVMAANCDDHTKNFAFMLEENGAWKLSPAYDLTHAHNPKGEWTFQHLMSINGKFGGADDVITESDVLTISDRFLVKNPVKIIDEVREALRAWRVFARDAGVGETETRRIEADFNWLE